MGPKVLAWNGLGGYSFPRVPTSGSCTFSDHHMDNLTSQLYLFWYRNLSDFKTIKEYSSRRQAVVFVQHGYRCEGKFEAGFWSGKETVQLRFTAVLCTLGFWACTEWRHSEMNVKRSPLQERMQKLTNGKLAKTFSFLERKGDRQTSVDSWFHVVWIRESLLKFWRQK